MANIKSTQISSMQIRDQSIDQDKVGQSAIGNSNLVDGSVTAEKIASGSVTSDKIDDVLSARLLPISVGEVNYQEALQATSIPSASNPFATMNDVKGNSKYWGPPSGSLPTFGGDPSGSVKLSVGTGSLYYKIDDETVGPVVSDHSAASNLESLPDHRHVTAREKSLLSGMVSAGVTPSAVASAMSTERQAVPVFVHQDFYDVGDGDTVVFVHKEIDDPQRHRVVSVMRNYDATDFTTSFNSLGHGIFFGGPDAGSGVFNPIDHVVFPNAAGKYVVEARDQNVDAGVVGMRVRNTESTVSSVDRDSLGQIVVSTDPPVMDGSVPMIVTPLRQTDGVGHVGHVILTKFKKKYSITEQVREPVIVSDAEGSYYVFYLDVAGRLRAKRYHSSGEFKSDVTLLPSSSGDLWTGVAFTSVKAAIVIRKDQYTSNLAERFFVLSLVDADGAGWVLVSSSVSRSFGSVGRTSDSTSISLAEARFTTGAWENHLPRRHEIYVVSQGEPEATAIILTCDDASIVWTSVNDATVSLSRSGYLSYSMSGVDFKGAATKRSIELVVRSSDGLGRWARTAARIPTGKWGDVEQESRPSSEYAYISDVPPELIGVSSTTVVIAGVSYEVAVTAWASSEGLSLLVQKLDDSGSNVVGESFAVRRDVAPRSLRVFGEKHVHVLSSGDPGTAGLSYRRIAVGTDLVAYVDKCSPIGEKVVLSSTSSRYRVSYTDAGVATVTSRTLQAEPLLGFDGMHVNEHDLAILCDGPRGVEILEAERPVRLRSIIEQNPSTSIVDSMTDQLSTVQSLRLWNSIEDVESSFPVGVEGAAASSFANGSTEWMVITGGVDSPDRQSEALDRIMLVRTIISGTPGHPGFKAKTIAPRSVRRAFHGQCVIGNASSCAVPSVPGASCFVFTFGGRRAGGVDKDPSGAFASNVLTRFLLHDVDDDTSDMSDVSCSSASSVDLSAGIPALLKPTLFACWDGTLWRLVVVRAPRVWILRESSPGTLFGPTMPGVANVFDVGANPTISATDRSACAFFQRSQASPTTYVWNPDLQLSRPGVTTVLCVSSENSTVSVMDFDPGNDTNIRWDSVSISSNVVPSPRVDASLVWSGVKKTSNGVPDRHLFMLYGGLVDGKPSSEVWLFEYWRNESGAATGSWVFLTDSAHYGIAPAVSSPYGVRRPTATSRSSISNHAVVFGGGRLSSGSEEPGAVMLQVPYQMKQSVDAPLEGMGMDMGGDFLPSMAYVVAGGLDVDNVAALGGPVVAQMLSGYDDEGLDQVRIAVGSDGTDQLYSFKYDEDSSSWLWSTAFSIDDMPDEACTLREFSLGMVGEHLTRGVTPFFTAATRKLYFVLMVPAMDSNDEMKVSSLEMPSYLQSYDANDNAAPTWMKATDGFKVSLPSPRSVAVRNDTGDDVPRLRIVVGSPPRSPG